MSASALNGERGVVTQTGANAPHRPTPLPAPRSPVDVCNAASRIAPRALNQRPGTPQCT